MKKFMNTPESLLGEALAGFAAAHADLVALDPEGRFVTRRTPNKGKVALISGGGSGHEPLHAGFVGFGMLDAACPGQVFTSPTPDQMLAAAETVGGEPGVLFIVKNYEGDVMNFDMAAEMAGGRIAQLVVDDDVAIEGSARSTGRRGVAGTVMVEKIVGAAAEEDLDLDGCLALGRKVVERTRSMGVALTSCTVPAAGRPTFSLADDEMEFGVGIHGEPGRARLKLKPARELAADMVDAVVKGLGGSDRDVLLFVNGFGGTPPMELYLMYQEARAAAEKHGLRVVRSLVGSYVTSLEMAGCSITLTRMDAEMLRLWDAPARTAAMTSL